ncbi:MAG: SGNH/GDSL hydrolase family protein [Kiritimatiellae bacterium]|nr:SGNH/GDSL hydrolase family protein [Kiritimatiellia bacterium]
MKTIKFMLLSSLIFAGACCVHGKQLKPEELVECPVSENLRGHENQEWSRSDAYSLIDGASKFPRALLVGDSICNAYKGEVRKILMDKKMTMTYWVSSYCVTSPGYLRLLSFYLDEAKYDVIHFNNGLHSLGTPTADWEKGLRAVFTLIRMKQPNAKIVWCNSTPLKNPKMTAKAKELNETARRVIKDFEGIVENDLFGLMDGYDRNTYWSDTFHFKREAVKMQADQTASIITKQIGR